jgi:hypothetical protein
MLVSSDQCLNGTPYLNQSFSNFDVHVCGISEHSVHYKQLYNGNYTVITKPEPAPNLLLFVYAFEYTEARVSKISKWSLNTSKGLNDEDS